MCDAPAVDLIREINLLKKHWVKMQELRAEIAKEHNATLTIMERIITTCGGACPYMKEEERKAG